jgi:hypothetical protein
MLLLWLAKPWLMSALLLGLNTATSDNESFFHAIRECTLRA